MDNYKILEKIGHGTFGIVYRARNEKSNEVVAVKQARIQQTYHGVPREYLREISVLKQTDKFKHPNIIRLIDLFMHDDEDNHRLMQLTLVFEYIEQDLSQFLQYYPQTKLPTNEIKNIVLQLVCGLEFLHSLSIIHRDLKPPNVLISTEGVIKIADFGLSKFIWIQKVVTPEVITLWYRAPEVLLNCDYSNKVDMWSLGCIFAELVNRRPLFSGRTEIELLQNIFKVVGVPKEEQFPKDCIITLDQFPNYTPQPMSKVIPDITDLGIDLFKNLMRFDLRERITAANVVEHAWFDDIITCRRPSIMTRQRHTMPLAGPIPSLVTEDEEIEVRGVKRRQSSSPEASSSKKGRPSTTPKKEPPKTPKKDAPKTPRKHTPRKDMQKTPKKFVPKHVKKDTPRKETPRKDTPKKDTITETIKSETPRKDTPKKEVRIKSPEREVQSIPKLQSPRKSERLENKAAISPDKSDRSPARQNKENQPGTEGQG